MLADEGIRWYHESASDDDGIDSCEKETQRQREDVVNTQFESFAVIPAAGRSRRMGRQKLLLEWRGTTILEQVISAWRASAVGHVVVVVRADDEQLKAVCRRVDVELVAAEVPPPQMKDSVSRAVAHIRERFAPREFDAWLLAPADLPSLSPQAIDLVLRAHRTDDPQILVAASSSGRGHPVLFPWSLAGEIDSLGDNEGVNALLARHPVREIAVGSHAEGADVDTPEDYRRLLQNGETGDASGDDAPA